MSCCSNTSRHEEGNELSSSDDEYDADESLHGTVVHDCDFAAAHHAIQNGADVKRIWHMDRKETSYLFEACANGNAEIVHLLLEAGADALYKNWNDETVLHKACQQGHLKIIETLLNHDQTLLEIADEEGQTPLIFAIQKGESEISRLLLDRGANAEATDREDQTPLKLACENGNLEIVRQLLAAGVNVEARDQRQRTALHYAANRGRIEIVREFVLQHNANMTAIDNLRKTPFDVAGRRDNPQLTLKALLKIFADKSIQEHGRLALHAILNAAEYSYVENQIYDFHPPLNPLRISLLMGKLTLLNLHTLMQHFDTELIRTRDDSGKLPIHIACRNHAPVEVLSVVVEIDPTILQIADHADALPIHLFCDISSAGATTEYASVRYLVEQGGIGTLAARNHQGALPLHVLCGSTRPSWRTVRYLIQSFSGSVAESTNAGDYPFMVAACEESSASLSVVYELVRANPGLLIRNNG